VPRTRSPPCAVSSGTAQIAQFGTTWTQSRTGRLPGHQAATCAPPPWTAVTPSNRAGCRRAARHGRRWADPAGRRQRALVLLVLWAIGRAVTAAGSRRPAAAAPSRHYLAGRVHGVRITVVVAYEDELLAGPDTGRRDDRVAGCSRSRATGTAGLASSAGIVRVRGCAATSARTELSCSPIRSWAATPPASRPLRPPGTTTTRRAASTTGTTCPDKINEVTLVPSRMRVLPAAYPELIAVLAAAGWCCWAGHCGRQQRA
jgi:hypothetical protein